MKRLIAVIIVCMIALAACTPNQSGLISQAKAWDSTDIATWDGASLSMTEYVYFLWAARYDTEQQLLYEGSYNAENIREFWSVTENGDAAMEEILREQCLENALHYATLLKLANDAGITAGDDIQENASQAIDMAMTALEDHDCDGEHEHGADVENAFIMEYGVSPEQMKTLFVNMEIINLYLYTASLRADFSTEEIMAAYNENPDYFEKVTARHILVGTEGMNDDEKAKAKAKAEDILAQIRAGADIGELAAEHSDDPGSRNSNGEYTFGRHEMVDEFDAWAFSASAGDTGIVETRFGYHIMQLMHRFTVEELADSIHEYMGSMAANQLVEDAMSISRDRWTVNYEAAENAPLFHD